MFSDDDYDYYYYYCCCLLRRSSMQSIYCRQLYNTQTSIIGANENTEYSTDSWQWKWCHSGRELSFIDVCKQWGLTEMSINGHAYQTMVIEDLHADSELVCRTQWNTNQLRGYSSWALAMMRCSLMTDTRKDNAVNVRLNVDGWSRRNCRANNQIYVHVQSLRFQKFTPVWGKNHRLEVDSEKVIRKRKQSSCHWSSQNVTVLLISTAVTP